MGVPWRAKFLIRMRHPQAREGVTEAEDVKEQMERWKCRLAERTPLFARDELQNVSATLAGAESTTMHGRGEISLR